MPPGELMSRITPTLSTMSQVEKWQGSDWIVDPSISHEEGTPGALGVFIGTEMDEGLSSSRIVEVISRISEMCEDSIEQVGTQDEIEIHWGP